MPPLLSVFRLLLKATLPAESNTPSTVNINSGANFRLTFMVTHKLLLIRLGLNTVTLIIYCSGFNFETSQWFPIIGAESGATPLLPSSLQTIQRPQPARLRLPRRRTNVRQPEQMVSF